MYRDAATSSRADWELVMEREGRGGGTRGGYVRAAAGEGWVGTEVWAEQLWGGEGGWEGSRAGQTETQRV